MSISRRFVRSAQQRMNMGYFHPHGASLQPCLRKQHLIYDTDGVGLVLTDDPAHFGSFNVSLQRPLGIGRCYGKALMLRFRKLVLCVRGTSSIVVRLSQVAERLPMSCIVIPSAANVIKSLRITLATGMG
jgi:hypothetical protein